MKEEKNEVEEGLPEFNFMKNFDIDKELDEIQDFEMNFVSGFDLFNFDIEEVPKLVEPFFQKVGVASLVGSSDTGKSTILRQLALCVALNKSNWMRFKLNLTHKKVIYVSTEDDKYSVSKALKSQLKSLDFIPKTESELLHNISFVFDTGQLLAQLTQRLKDNPVDLIVIDAFTDVFTKEINSSTEVRKFLSQYHNLALKNECLIIFLHHTGKRTQKQRASKDNVLGSQAFEAKMRCVLSLRQDFKDLSLRHLCILKGNYISSEKKAESYVLKFDEDNLFFKNTNNRVPLHSLNDKSTSKFKTKPDLKSEAKQLKKEGKSVRDIAKILKKKYGANAPGKSTIGEWVKG